MPRLLREEALWALASPNTKYLQPSAPSMPQGGPSLHALYLSPSEGNILMSTNQYRPDHSLPDPSAPSFASLSPNSEALSRFRGAFTQKVNMPEKWASPVVEIPRKLQGNWPIAMCNLPVALYSYIEPDWSRRQYEDFRFSKFVVIRFTLQAFDSPVFCRLSRCYHPVLSQPELADTFPVHHSLFSGRGLYIIGSVPG